MHVVLYLAIIHEYPLLPHMRQMWEAQATFRGQKLPQNPTPSQLAVLTNTFPQQGFVASQPQPGQAAHPPNLMVPFSTKSL